MVNLHYDQEFGYPVVGAFGLRRLVSTYGGPILKLRNPRDDSLHNVFADASGKLAQVGIATPSVGNHKYWRVKVLSGYNSNYFAIAGIKMFANEDGIGTDLCTGGTPFGNGHAGANVALRAFDNNIATYYESDSGALSDGNSWVGYEFASNVQVKSIALVGGPDATDKRPVSGVVQYSDDGTSWDKAFDFGALYWEQLASETNLINFQWYITRIFDQSDNGAYLEQTVDSKQPFLKLNATGAGHHVAVFDGVNDFMRDSVAATDRPYMVANPVIVSLSGAKFPRSNWGKTWNIPHNDGANGDPYSRLVFEQEADNGNTNNANLRVNANSNEVTKLYGMSNRKGFSAHALVPQLGKFYQHGAPSTDVTTVSTVTYPNNTRLYIGCNGSATECNGMNWTELVIMATSSANGTVIQAAVDKLSWSILTGDNRYYRLTSLGSFADDPTDGGMAEFEARATIGGDDLTEPNIAFMASRRYNSSETWYNAIDNNNGSVYSSSGGAVPAIIHFMLNENTEIAQTLIKARSDSYSQYTIKKFKLARWTENGWQETNEIDNTAQGVSSGQSYLNIIDWASAPPIPTTITKDVYFDYELFGNIPSTDIIKNVSFDYKILASVTKDVTFNYQIINAFSRDITFDYKIIVSIAKDVSFDYKIKLSLDTSFDYSIFRSFGISYNFEYKIGMYKLADFDYKIKLFSDHQFNYEIVTLFHANFSFSYKIAMAAIKQFDYSIKLFADFQFNYEIVVSSVPVTGAYVWRLPEVPVIEVWEYKTKVSTMISGLEQRSSIRRRPRIMFTHTHVILTDDDFRTFQNELLTQLTGDIRIPQHSQTVAVKAPTEYGDNIVYCKMSSTDIRVGDIVAFFDIGTEEAFLRFVAATDSDSFTMTEPYPFTDHRGVAITPTRLMRFADSSANNMSTVWGGNDLTFVDASSRDIVRPTAVSNLVPQFDGYPVVMKRPLANEQIADAYSAGLNEIDLSQRLPPSAIRNWKGVAVTRTYEWSFRRGADLDYWRELADRTRGSWRAFLMPTFRPDLRPVSSAGALVTVAGNMLETVLIVGGYKRLMITTDLGVSLHRIDGVVIDGDNTNLTLNTPVSGTIKQISFVNLVRVSDDVFRFSHEDTVSKLDLNLRVVHQ